MGMVVVVSFRTLAMDCVLGEWLAGIGTERGGVRRLLVPLPVLVLVRCGGGGHTYTAQQNGICMTSGTRTSSSDVG